MSVAAGKDQGSPETDTHMDPGNPTDETTERPTRERTLTEKGTNLYESYVKKYSAKLSDVRRNIEKEMEVLTSRERNIINLTESRDNLLELLKIYKENAKELREFLQRTNTTESRNELVNQDSHYSNVMMTVEPTLDELVRQLDGREETRSRRSGSRISRSRASTTSSILARQRAKAEAAKAQLEFAAREAEIKRNQAKIEEEELKAKAEIMRKKSEAQLNLDVLIKEKEAAVAEAELQAVKEELENETSKSTDYRSVIDSTERTRQYVIDQNNQRQELNPDATLFAPITDTRPVIDNTMYHQDLHTIPRRVEEIYREPHVTTQYIPTETTPKHVPDANNTLVANELAKFLLKKDLLMSRFTSYNDQPESYPVWKASFRNITRELGVTPSEELDLLAKWLGPESSKHAISLRIANASDPGKGLKRVWERLEERYGGPEMIESNIKRKLDRFPKITNRDYKKLYDLSDILAEILSLKEDTQYAHLLSYFDTSLGVNQIITKLPYGIQTKWIDRASKYKQANSTQFPPFTFFVNFIKDISKQFNDPGFILKDDTRAPRPQINNAHYKHSNFVTSRKTDVSRSQSKPSDKLTECPIHHTKHTLNDCRTFKAKTLNERKRILRENNICYKCCESAKHIYRDCKETVQCQECKSSRHPTALHIVKEDQNAKTRGPVSPQGGEETADNNVETKCTAICGEGFKGKSCSKVVLVNVYKKDEPQNVVKLYALMDDQSNRTLGRTELFDALHIESASHSYNLSSCAGRVQKWGRFASGLVVEPVNGHMRMDLPTIVECNEIPNTRQEIPTPEIRKHYEHFKNVPIPDIDMDAQILLLIGRDLIDAHHVYEQRIGGRNMPFAQRLSLGWVVIGEVCLGRTHKPSQDVYVNKTCILNNGRPTAFDPCENIFHLKETNVDTTNYHDNMGKSIFQKTKDDEKIGLSVEDQNFITLMDNEFVKNDDEHWSAPLPFRDARPRLPNNRAQAFKRAKILQHCLQRDTVKKKHFVDFMQDMFDNGHAEVAPPLGPSEECWYLPLFGVYHPKKKDKIRVVFDASAKYEGVSLNNVLMSGPDLTNSLVGVLLRFRREPIAVAADIQQMFYGFYVQQKHRNFLRFLWHKDNDTSKDIIEYRMCVHVFGNTPSPAIATYGLRKCVNNEDTNEKVKEYVNRNFYVDDGLATFTNAEEAIEVLKATQKTLYENGKLKLHKIASNSERVMKAFNSDDLAKDLKSLDLHQDELPVQHSLGLCWDLQNDSFSYKLSTEDKPITRRGVLSTINSLYDPLGFIAPVVLQGRILMRDIISETNDWDMPLQNDIQQKWLNWKTSLEPLELFSIRRCFVPSSFFESIDKQLHIFADASEKAIASVAFLRTVDSNGSVHVGFVFGKSKVAPKHGHTIPRLELCAAVLAVEIGEMLSDQLDITGEEIMYYSDSRVVLGYLRNEVRRFHVYVSNRVGKIRRFSKPQQWHYVSTDDNPADHGTRHVTADQIQQSTWLLGPPFLQRSDISHELSDKDFPLVNPQHDKELKPDIQVLKTSTSKPNRLGATRFNRFSKWRNLIEAISRLQRLVRKYQVENTHERSSANDIDFYRKAEQFIIKEVQQEYYGQEIQSLRNRKPLPRTSSVFSLCPFIDDDGILRVGGRLRNTTLPPQEKTPILIPGKHNIATLIIRHYHESIHHQGRHFTEGAIRSAGFWITGCKRLVSSILFKCVKCRRLRGTLCTQKMADLPSDRLTPSPPFTFVGVDVFGPWRIVTRRTRGGSAESKRWAVLFTCLTSRAVHIEIIEEMSASSFINALRRFYAIRGKVQEFRSDRGTNFIGSTDALRIDTLNVEDGPLKKFLYNSGTIWKFNTPLSSHMGGVWERLIGVTRRILDAMLLDLKCRNLTHEVLATFMSEVSAIINARPIVPVSSDIDSPFILTPSVLLTQKTGNRVEDFNDFCEKDMYKSQWKCVQALAETFWKRWSREYLPTLQKREKWTQEKENLCEGDVILMRDKDCVRNNWPVGIIKRVFESDDKLVRKVEVQVNKHGKPVTYVRPITEMVKLLSK